MNDKFIKAIVLLLSIGFFCSCEDFLDKQPTGDMTLDDVFADRIYTQRFLSNIYSRLPVESDFADIYNGIWYCGNPFVGGSDEMEIAFGGAYSHEINQGSWNSTNILPVWTESYAAIRECNIFLAKKGEELRHAGSSDEELSNENITDYIKNVMEKEEEFCFEKDEMQFSIFPMKNNFECIGVIEIIRKIERPLEFEYADLIQNMAGLFVTSMGLQKLIDEVKRLIGLENVSTLELQNLRAQLTAIIGDLGDQQQTFVEKLAYAVDLKGQYKRSHSNECANLSREICEHMGLNEKTTDLIYYAGLLQNIGKITLSEELFTKKDKLTDAEWNELKNHPNVGVDLLMNINFMSEVVPYINYQEERYNGKGFPEGLKGNSIPLGSRIIALAGAYCALTQDRAHRKALSNTEALEIIKKESGTKWDPKIVDVLIEIKK